MSDTVKSTDDLFDHLINSVRHFTFTDKIMIFNFNHFDWELECVIDHMAMIIPYDVFIRLKLLNPNFNLSVDGINPQHYIIITGKYFDITHGVNFYQSISFANDISWFSHINNWGSYNDSLTEIIDIILDHKSLLLSATETMNILSAVKYRYSWGIPYVSRI